MARKVHTRAKRKFGVRSHLSGHKVIKKRMRR